ncbi:MAG: DUF2029 domain-containing protein [Flavobacteriales bacterium]|nr:DUF2029 domain-containing protein [Flavobacteriales bacterium]
MKDRSTSFVYLLRNDRTVASFTVITGLICLGYYFLELANHRAQMADFRVYYDAANAFIHDTQLYGKAFGVSSGFYKYSPFACIPFIPLAILPYPIASFIYYLLIMAAICWFMVKLFHELHPSRDWKSSRYGWALFLVALFMADHLERELHLGNVNLFLLILGYAVFLALRSNRQIRAGIFMGILLLFKPHFLILLPYFVWKKKWTTLFAGFGTILMGVLIPTLIKGYDGNVQLHAEWLMAMKDHNVKLEESPNTIYGILNHFVLNHHGSLWLVIAVLMLVAGLFAYFLIRNKRIEQHEEIRFSEYFLLIALIPNLTHTDTEHFMWSWPLIAYVIISLLTQPVAGPWKYAIAMFLAFIPYCVNSPDIVGKKIRFLFDEGGLLGTANLIIILCAVLIYLNQTRNNHLYSVS